MKAGFKAGVLVIGVIGALCLVLGSDTPAPAKEWSWEGLKEQVKTIKDLKSLNLSPEKEAALLEVNRKYAAERQELAAALKKYHGELQAALAGAGPDEEHLKKLVGASKEAQDKLVASLQRERDEALALMTPVQQGQFLMLLGHRYEEKAQKPSGMEKLLGKKKD